MATTYAVKGSYATIQVTSASQVVDVLRISFETIPSGVLAVASAPYRGNVGIQPGDVDGIAATYIEPIATGIERVMGTGRVASAAAFEDVNASGLVIDMLAVVVQYQPTGGAVAGPFQQQLDLPLHAFGLDPGFFNTLILAPINAAYDAMVALAGL
jgi:hypothetical protein